MRRATTWAGTCRVTGPSSTPALHGDLVYAAVDRGGEQPGRVVLSLSTGRVLASSDDPLPDLLPGEWDSLC
ncbi:MAG TPA: hypothetical protein VJB61_09520 [Actinomycetota bacterium]